MRVIIAGSREGFEYADVVRAIELSGLVDKISEVVSGCARGVDKFGEQWAKDNGIPIKSAPAKWKEFGLAAGPIRNQEMADYAEALIAVHDGVSTGTADMIKRARRNKLVVYVYIKGATTLFDF